MEIPVSRKELFYRVSDVRWIASHFLRQITQAWDAVSPTEFARIYRQIRGLTMCSNARLRGLYTGLQYVERMGVQGDVVECGTARGGSAALMALTLDRLKSERKLFVFDTFTGMPVPTMEDPDFEIANLYTGSCCGTIEDVSASFERLGIRLRTNFIKGLFQDTLPVAPIGNIALLHVDGDWYESVKACLENLYDKVSPGGVIQIDDYGFWKGARRAVDEFLKVRAPEVKLQYLDYSGRQFVKP